MGFSMCIPGLLQDSLKPNKLPRGAEGVHVSKRNTQGLKTSKILRRNRGNFTKQDALEMWGWIPSLQHLCLKRCSWILWDFVILGYNQLGDEGIQGCEGQLFPDTHRALISKLIPENASKGKQLPMGKAAQYLYFYIFLIYKYIFLYLFIAPLCFWSTHPGTPHLFRELSRI